MPRRSFEEKLFSKGQKNLLSVQGTHESNSSMYLRVLWYKVSMKMIYDIEPCRIGKATF